MALVHAEPGKPVTISPSGGVADDKTAALFKSEQLEVIRTVLPKGKQLPSHHVQGEVVVQCLDGHVTFTARGRTVDLRAGQLLHLLGGDEHACEAREDSSLLVTIVLPTAPSSP